MSKFAEGCQKVIGENWYVLKSPYRDFFFLSFNGTMDYLIKLSFMKNEL
jgi:hypothetical protein